MSDTIPEVLRAARLLFRPGDVVEVRVPKAGKLRTIAGYFDDFEKLAAAVATLELARHPGVYWTLNPGDPAMLSRAGMGNRLKAYIDAGDLTSDGNILRHAWLPIDLDPKRPTGTSSTDAQHEAALALGRHVQETLVREGWPAGLLADSGNGAHLLYAVGLPNDRESSALLSGVLKALGTRFNTRAPDVLVEVDERMFNASRIIKTYGTTARKGDASPERPHRLSQILYAPEPITTVPVELLREVAKLSRMPATPRPGSTYRATAGGQEFSVEDFLSRHGIRYRDRIEYRGGWKYRLEECPWDSSHKWPDACVFQYPDGYGFTCLHNSCNGRDWHAFREQFEGPRRQWSSFGPPRGLPARDEDAPPARLVDDPAPLTLADVEAAAELAIESKSAAEAMRLATAIATLRPQHQAVVVAKLRDGFGDAWKANERWFDKALKDAAPELPKKEADSAPDVAGQNAPAGPSPGEGGRGAKEPPDLVPYPLTDSGNGERIVAMFGGEIRYCNEMESWFVWDGRRWAIDRKNAMRQKANQMARLLYYQCLALPEGSRRTAVSKHALASESSRGISNALMEAARMPGVPVLADELDQHPMHLNFLNGTVLLSDGSIRPHDRAMLLTKLCEYPYRPEAKCPLFQGFVEWTMGGPVDGNPDAELSETTTRLVGFVQRVIGYSITGDVGEKCVFVFYGADGDNGKTTLLTLFRELLGRDYASLLLIDTIMHARSTDNTAREDMADLRGARFVQTSEISKEDRLNEQRVKFLTQGMGTIKSRRLHEHLIEFTATHKLLMDCNYRPKVTGQDNAIWRRLIQVPFQYTIPEERKDLHFRDKLKAEAEGILAWAVRGAIEWRKRGLGKPPEVAEAARDWREHDDPLREFLADWCNVDLELYCPVSDLMTAYLLWSKEYGEKFPLARRAFNEALAGKGIVQDKRRVDHEPTRIWVGVELKPQALQKLHRGEQRSLGAPRDEDVPTATF
jgi:P4 family phage/plasmid primase-like protien